MVREMNQMRRCRRMASMAAHPSAMRSHAGVDDPACPEMEESGVVESGLRPGVSRWNAEQRRRIAVSRADGRDDFYLSLVLCMPVTQVAAERRRLLALRRAGRLEGRVQ